MQRIQTLLDKISTISNKGDKADMIEIDLMLDYTKVLYADLLELKDKISFTNSLDTQADSHTPEEAIITNTEPIIVEEQKTNSEPTVIVTESNKKEEVHTTKYEHQPERKNINKHIGINDKYQYISELFGNDKARYDEVLNRINTFENSNSAINWLQEEIKTEQNWDDDMESVQMFYDTVNNFFSSK